MTCHKKRSTQPVLVPAHVVCQHFTFSNSSCYTNSGVGRSTLRRSIGQPPMLSEQSRRNLPPSSNAAIWAVGVSASMQGARSAPLITMFIVHRRENAAWQCLDCLLLPQCRPSPTPPTAILPRARLDPPSGSKLRRRGVRMCAGRQAVRAPARVAQSSLVSQTVPGWYPSWTCDIDEDVRSGWTPLQSSGRAEMFCRWLCKQGRPGP